MGAVAHGEAPLVLLPRAVAARRDGAGVGALGVSGAAAVADGTGSLALVDRRGPAGVAFAFDLVAFALLHDGGPARLEALRATVLA